MSLGSQFLEKSSETLLISYWSTPLKALDKKTLNPTEQQKISDYFPKQQQAKIIKNTRYVTSWVHDLIKTCFAGR